jgi:hypothetical protein
MLLNSLDGFIKEILERSLQFLLLDKESVDVVLSALFELSECLL